MTAPAPLLRITRAGQIEGTGRRIAVRLRATAEQRRIFGVEEFEVECSPLTGGMQVIARTMHPDAVPPTKPVEGAPGKFQLDADCPEYAGYRALQLQQSRQQKVVIAALALGLPYFGTDVIDEQIKTLLGPAEKGGFVYEQIEQIADAAAAASSMTPERQEEVKAEMRPIASIGPETTKDSGTSDG